MQSTWEEAHSVALRDCLEKGMSFAEIARALNERFGTAYTRNAAIGRARRLGLSVPMRERAARALNKPKQADARRIRELRARKAATAPNPPHSNAPPPFSFGASRSRRVIWRWLISRPAIAATLTVATSKANPLRFAAIRARKVRAIALRILI
jgi:hypothetical protein